MIDDRPHMTRRHESPETFATSNAPHSSAANASVSGVPPSHLTVSTIIAGFAAGGVIVLAILMTILWSEYRLASLDLADMKAAMLAHGVNPHPHTPGEAP